MQENWHKLKQLLFLKQTQNDMLTLSADDSYIVKWKCDSSYVVHPDMKSHTGTFMTMGQGVVTRISKKQKLNTRSSTEVELVSSDNIMGDVLWTQLLLQE